MIGYRTRKYLNKPYLIGFGGNKLNIGDSVYVYPTVLSQSNKRYKAKIILESVHWTDGKSDEICTYVKGKHSAVINNYLFDRLEKI